MQDTIRNFAIIAHIDHGKSTLADRLLELTGTISKESHEEQLLDRNPISRERGITIKLAPVRMSLKNSKFQTLNSKQFQNSNEKDQLGFRESDLGFSNSKEFILNLIDTPGHVDFSYEVDRTLACVEGVILLVDATQGIQAQTIANAYKAIEKNLVIIPVVNKIDLPSAQVEKTKKQLVDFLGVKEDEIFEVSAKTGLNVEKLLNALIYLVPSPKNVGVKSEGFPTCLAGRQAHAQSKETLDTYSKKDISAFPEASTGGKDRRDRSHELQALIFDSYYDSHRGVIAFVRIFSGQYKKGMKVRMHVNGKVFEVNEVGIFTPDLKPKDSLDEGEIGYVVTNLKDIHEVQVGDTITDQKGESPAVSGYKKVQPMVFASMFPTDTQDYLNLQKSLEKLALNDSSLDFSAIYSTSLGAGYRVGFLGLLHADVVRERLEREFNLHLVLTPPQVEYKVEKEQFYEPIVKLLIITPDAYVGNVMQLCESYRATFVTMDNKNQISLSYEMPMSEMVSDFFDNLKSVSSGYASLDWEFLRYDPVKADKLIILLNDDEVEEFSEIVVLERAQEKAYALTKKLREIIPRQQYEVKIQAKYKGKIIASERISPFRKDVLVKNSKTVGAGDVGRKKKLLEKQKEGKKRMKMIGKVEIPKEAFMKLFNKS